MRGVVLPHGHVGAPGQAPARAVRLVALERLARLERAREGRPHLVEHVPEPGEGGGVLGQLARGGRVRDVVGAGLAEDAVVGDGEADDAAEVRFRHAAFAGEVGDGDGAVEGDVRGDVVFVDCLEAYAVQLRFTAPSSVEGFGDCGVWVAYDRSEAHGGPEEKLVEFKTGVEGRFAGFLDFFIFDFEIDGAVCVE